MANQRAASSKNMCDFRTIWSRWAPHCAHNWRWKTSPWCCGEMRKSDEMEKRPYLNRLILLRVRPHKQASMGCQSCQESTAQNRRQTWMLFFIAVDQAKSSLKNFADFICPKLIERVTSCRRFDPSLFTTSAYSNERNSVVCSIIFPGPACLCEKEEIWP